MIEIKELKESDKERLVLYRGFNKVEIGHITSWNDVFIFVRYFLSIDPRAEQRIDEGVSHRYGETSAATNPEDLEFCEGYKYHEKYNKAVEDG